MSLVQLGGGVDGWDKQAQALVMDEQQMGTCTSVDAAIAMNMRLCAALRAVLVDANVERTKLADEKENELAPQLQVRSHLGQLPVQSSILYCRSEGPSNGDTPYCVTCSCRSRPHWGHRSLTEPAETRVAGWGCVTTAFGIQKPAERFALVLCCLLNLSIVEAQSFLAKPNCCNERSFISVSVHEIEAETCACAG